jgi:hypothetical protein
MKHDTSDLEPLIMCLALVGFGVSVLFGIALLLNGCSRNDVGDEKNNPAPSSHLTLAEAQMMGAQWVQGDFDNRRWSTPTPTSSMVPYMDSHSVLFLHKVDGPVRLHDILVVYEGPGRENVCHQVVKLRGDAVYLDGKNNKWPDGWYPLSQAKWRVVGVIYSRG